MSSRSDVAVSVQGLSKAYTIAHNAAQHTTAGEALMHKLRNPFERAERETFWALKDVSFDIHRGEVVGIIGRNGAGKSTLLKVLSRITEPTRGRAVLNGRVGSLLEVGTGFHPELTGRENIYLNGAILGMNKREVARQFDAIVDFAGVAQFLDTPVKRYSSGMYVRLAFAVAAHLNPEILIVDEVLAVGDAEFQKKCLGKMHDVAEQNGKTILFVSHNMGAITQLCSNCIFMQAGRIKSAGPTGAIVKRYLYNNASDSSEVRLDATTNLNSPIVFTRCWIENIEGVLTKKIDVKDGYCIGLEIEARRSISDVEITVRIDNSLGHPVFATNRSQTLEYGKVIARGKSAYVIQVPGNFLAPDTYSVTIGAHRPQIELFDLHENLLTFEVEESGSDLWQYQGYGNILVRFPWQSLDDSLSARRN